MEKLESIISNMFKPLKVNLFDYPNLEEEKQEAKETLPLDYEKSEPESTNSTNCSLSSDNFPVNQHQIKGDISLKISRDEPPLPRHQEIVISLCSSSEGETNELSHEEKQLRSQKQTIPDSVLESESLSDDLEIVNEVEAESDRPQITEEPGMIGTNSKILEKDNNNLTLDSFFVTPQQAEVKPTNEQLSFIPLKITNKVLQPSEEFLEARKQQEMYYVNNASFIKQYPEFVVNNKCPYEFTLDESLVQAFQAALEKMHIPALRVHENVILAYIALRKSVLASVATSGGKSLIYTLPAITFHCITVVITPTIALREDEIKGLRQNNVNAVEIGEIGIDGNISKYDLEYEKECVLFLTPEKLCMDSKLQEILIELITNRRIALFAIDECHLMVEWSGFRNKFDEIPQVLRNIIGNYAIPIICLSASLPESDLRIIQAKFGFLELELLEFDVYRPNLHIYLKQYKKVDKFKQNEHLLTYLSNCDDKVLVYVRKTDDCDKIAKENSDILEFHSCCRNSLENAQEWQNSQKIKALVATVGFGMGINVKLLNNVYIYDFPNSVNDWMQKIGRVGRTGEEGYSYFAWDFQIAFKMLQLIIMDREGNKANRIIEFFNLYLILNRPACQFAQLQQYYIGYNIKQCGKCQGCKILREKQYCTIEVSKLARIICEFFKDSSLLAFRQIFELAELKWVFLEAPYDKLDMELTVFVLAAEMLVQGYLKLNCVQKNTYCNKTEKQFEGYYNLTIW